MDFHLQSSKVQATLETSHGCGMRAEPRSRSLKVETIGRQKMSQVPQKSRLPCYSSTIWLYPKLTLNHGIIRDVRDLWRSSPFSELGWLPR